MLKQTNKQFSLLQNFQTDFEAQTASYSNGTKYRLSESYCVSLPTTTALHVWEVGQERNVSIIKEPTGSDN